MALLVDGFPTFLSAAGLSGVGVLFREKELQPFGLTMGGGIETTNMRNQGWRTRANKALKDTEPMVGQVLYDPAIYTNFISLLGIITSWTVTFPDGSNHTVQGWLDSFTPQSHKEGDLPLAEVRIITSNSITRSPAGELGPV